MLSLTAAEAGEVNWNVGLPEQISPVVHLTQYCLSAMWPVRDDLNEDERPMLDYYKAIILQEKIFYIVFICYFYI